MKDLTERLRESGDPLCKEAAAYIRQLRAAGKDRVGTINGLKRENDALKAELRALRANVRAAA